MNQGETEEGRDYNLSERAEKRKYWWKKYKELVMMAAVLACLVIMVWYLILMLKTGRDPCGMCTKINPDMVCMFLENPYMP